MGRVQPGHNAGRKPFYKEFRTTFVEPSADSNVLSPELDNPSANSADNAFLFAPGARVLTVERAQAFDNTAAAEFFQALRWPIGVFCPECGSRNNYQRTSLRQWDCAECRTQFGLTSNTVFSSHKMPFRTLLIALAVTVGASRADTIVDAAKQMGVGYKYALGLVTKLRSVAALPVLPSMEKTDRAIIGQSRYINGLPLAARSNWTDSDRDALRRFVLENRDPAQAALALGRTPKSIVFYATGSMALRSQLPRTWRDVIRRPLAARIKATALSYPYVTTSRPEHTELLALNALVPHSYPEAMRADIVQEMMLAVLEGSVTIDEIRQNRSKAAWFLKKFWMANHEQSGHATSLSAFDDDERSYDEIASSIAAKDWHAAETAERSRYFDALHRPGFQPATQIEDVYQNQVGRLRRLHAMNGHLLTREEARDLLERDGKLAFPGSDQPSHAIIRAEQRYGLRLGKSAMREIRARIEDGYAQLIERQEEGTLRVTVSYGGRSLPVVYSPKDRTVITVLERATPRGAL